MYIIHICKKLQSQRNEEGSTPVKRGKKRLKRGAEASVKGAPDTHCAPREGLEEPNGVWASVQTAAEGGRGTGTRSEGGRRRDTHAQITLKDTQRPRGGGGGQEPLPREVPFRLQPPSELRRVFIRELLGHSQRRSVAAPSSPPHRASRRPPCHRQTRSRGRQRGKENNLAAPNPD